MKIRLQYLVGLLALCGVTTLVAVDNAHFYKAANLQRSLPTCKFDDLEKYESSDWYTKLDLNYGYGDTHKCWDKDGHSTELLNSTGAYNMLYVAENVVKQPEIKKYTAFLEAAQINHEKNGGTFGQLSFSGKFEINDFNIDLRQNIKWGIFLELMAPIRQVKIKNINYVDLSPVNGIFSQQTAQWRQFKNNLDVILADYGLAGARASYSETSFGDISLLLGWEKYLEKKDDPDMFLGITIKGGVLFPSGEKEDVNRVFSVPTGYNEHWAIPLNLQLEFGVCEWFNIAAHGSATIFFDKTHAKRMQTFNKQQGYIRLGKGDAEEDKGTLWHLGVDAKFDHFVSGLSFLVGYSYNREEKDKLTPKDQNLFDYTVVNGDPLLKEWYMHVVHFMIDYDFSVHMKNCKWAPKLNLFYNYPFDGHNAYKTDMIGGGLGLDIRWVL